MNTRSTRLSPIVAALAACALAVMTPSLRADTPDEYLDYVESTGTQMVDTGVNGADGLLVEAVMEWTSVPASGWACFLGSAASDSVWYCPYQIYDATTHRMAYKNQNPAVQGSSKPVSGVRYHVVVSMDNGAQTNTIRRIDGASMARVYTKSGTIVSDWRELAGPVDTELPMFVFARNLAGAADRFASARLYSLKIWRKDGNGAYQLLSHFLPCRKNNRAALYDKENETIHFPDGGELIAGPVLPRPKDFLEWVQADGADGDRQLYIDTGVPAKAGIGMVADMEWATKPAGNAVESIFCGATSSDSKRFWLYDAVADPGGATATHRMGYNSWKLQIQTGSSIYVQTRYRVETFLFKGEQSLTVSTNAPNGAWIALSTRSYNDGNDIDTQMSLFAFANNNAGTAAPVSAEARLYSLVLTNELGVSRDFVPCVADNGKAGLYDRVSERVFFPQAAAEGAAAEFDLDSEVGAATNRTASTAWPTTCPEYIEANGTNDYVDLGITARDGVRMVAEMEWNNLPAAATFCGAATNDHSGLFTNYRITTAVGDNFHRMGYYNGSSTLGGASCAPVAGVRYRVETSLKNGEQIISVKKLDNGAWSPVGNGTRTANLSFPAGFANLGIPLYLFARNMNGRPDEFAPARLYSFKLWQDGSLVRDIRPAYYPDDNAPALFDRLNWVWYFNDGGYRFEAGGATKPFVGRGTLLFVE